MVAHAGVVLLPVVDSMKVRIQASRTCASFRRRFNRMTGCERGAAELIQETSTSSLIAQVGKIAGLPSSLTNGPHLSRGKLDLVRKLVTVKFSIWQHDRAGRNRRALERSDSRTTLFAGTWTRYRRGLTSRLERATGLRSCLDAILALPRADTRREKRRAWVTFLRIQGDALDLLTPERPKASIKEAPAAPAALEARQDRWPMALRRFAKTSSQSCSEWRRFWRTRQDSNLWPLPSEGSALSS